MPVKVPINVDIDDMVDDMVDDIYPSKNLRQQVYIFVVLSTEVYTCESLCWLPTWDLPGRHTNVTCQARLRNG